jgi:alkylhydroperoxidase/carboxymuconolactone decarboxylase family protein YurZ
MVNKREMHDTFSPADTEAGENLTGGTDPDWTTPYVQYLTHGTNWEDDLPKEEQQLIAIAINSSY